MRIIIIVQSLIILVGAYYIYTLSQAVPVETTPLPIRVESSPINEREGYVPPTENPPGVDTAMTATSSVSGPNDAGMEYPILDTEIHVQ